MKHPIDREKIERQEFGDLTILTLQACIPYETDDPEGRKERAVYYCFHDLFYGEIKSRLVEAFVHLVNDLDKDHPAVQEIGDVIDALDGNKFAKGLD